METFELAVVGLQMTASGEPYLEFFRNPGMSVGLYRLPAGGQDGQQPHTEDEIYYVLGGRAMIRVGDEERQVGAGSVVFVEKNAAHRFHTITEDLDLLVVFSPAEGTGD